MPAYRGLGNSVFVSWEGPPGGLALTGFDFVLGGFPLTFFDNGAGPGIPTLDVFKIPEGTFYSFFVPNFVDPLSIKDMRIQVFHEESIPPDPGSASIVRILSADPDGPVTSVLVAHVPIATIPSMGAFYEDWALIPNPDWEFVDIFAPTGSALTGVIIDSISTPEPSTLVLAGMAGTFCLVGYGWRRRSRSS
ncbi:MAG: PEP-CTERM sorting domain-containing protein, partial [Woeseiaceae bacterium]